MNLAEMNEQLPNGLHDAEIESFTYDVAARRVSFSINPWIGTMDDPSSLRERYRRGSLHFEGVKFFTKNESWYLSDDELSFLTWKLEEDLEEKAKLSQQIECKFFNLTACYCEFRIACEDVFFEWTEATETNRNPNANNAI